VAAPLKQFLLLRLRADLTLREWAVANSVGAILRGPFPLENADFHSACQMPCLLFCSSPELIIRGVQVPHRAQDRFRQAIGFALEDRVASDIDGLHFALPESLQAGDTRCLIASKDALATLQAQLQRWGIGKAYLIPEALLLPPDSVLLERDIASFHLAEQQGAIEPDSLSLVLKQRRTQSPTSPITLYHTDQLGLKTLPAQVRAEPLGYVLHFLLQQSLALPRWGNLLALTSASAQPKAATSAQGNAVWRWAWRLAALAIALQLSAFAFRYLQLQRIEQAQMQDIRSMFQKVFPNLVAFEGSAMDPLAMLASRLQQDSSRASAMQGGGVLAILSLAAPILAGEARVVLVNAEYRNGELELGLRAPDLRTLDEVRARLATRPELRVTLGSNVVDPNGQMLTGRIKLALGSTP
jgi:general secretion pathway protein L